MQIPFEGNPIGYAITSGAPPTPPSPPMPTSGLVFYAPLSGAAQYADTGQSLINVNGTYTTQNGIPCIYVGQTDPYSYIYAPADTLPDGNASRTASFWLKTDTPSQWASTGYGYENQNQGWIHRMTGFSQYGSDFIYNVDNAANVWHHIVITYDADDSGLMKAYVDGEYVDSKYWGSLDTGAVGTNLYIGCSDNMREFTGCHYFASYRIYDRVLTQEEITALSKEFTQEGVITAEDMTTTFYQKDNSQGITYTSTYTPTFTIISGTLPNEISFNTSTGVFSGSAPTDQDHQYNLVVRISAENSTSVDVNVTINTVAVARIDFYGDTFNFTTEASESQYVNVYYSDEPVTLEYYSGTMPSGVTFDGAYFNSDGTQTASETQYVTLKATSDHNQDGVTAEFTINVNLNQLGLSNKTLTFYTDDGQVTKTLKYTTTNAITPVWSIISGSLPSGVTFDTTSGAFTSDGTQTADVSGTVGVQVASSTGCSAPASAVVTLDVVSGAASIPQDYVFYAPFDNVTDTTDETGNTGIEFGNSEYVTAETYMNIPCVKSSAGQTIATLSKTINQLATREGTISLWFNVSEVYGTFYFIGDYNNFRIVLLPNNNVIESTLGNNVGGRTEVQSGFIGYEWVNYVFTWDVANGVSNAYKNGVIKDTQSCFGNAYGSSFHIRGYDIVRIAAMRIYDRALNDSEIAALASEFTPIYS